MRIHIKNAKTGNEKIIERELTLEELQEQERIKIETERNKILSKLSELDKVAPRWLEDNADMFNLHQYVLDAIAEKQELRAKL